MSHFPQGLAVDSVFCNRERERQTLKKHILAHEHVVVVGPRRYGKTSLITQVLHENDFPGVAMDFFFVSKTEEVVQLIETAVSKIMTIFLPKLKKTLYLFLERFSLNHPKFSLQFLGQKFELSIKQKNQKTIAELLLLLDQFLVELKTHAVLVFDEFQQIAELPESHAIEAMIRHAAERSKRVSYIFCGSKRHLLNEMFSDKARPLYHLCELMTIDRIKTESYLPFLNQHAKKRWGKILSEEMGLEILNLAENHPYYVNALCRALWSEEKPPVLASVQKTWINYVDNQSAWILSDLSRLTLNQRKLLTVLASDPQEHLQTKSIVLRTNITATGLKKILASLMQLDLVFCDETGKYQVLDPAMASYLREHAHAI